jgi:hypothetical protein
MRFVAPLLILAALALTPADARASVICGTVGHTRTVRATDTVRVYKHRSEVYACAAGHRGRVDIGLDGDFVDFYYVRHVRIAGNFVAAVRSCGCRDASEAGPGLRVWDVARRREVAHYAPLPAPPYFPRITDVEVADDGTVAYLVHPPSASTTVEVHRNGDLLDSGPVGSRSLTLGGDDRMYWRHDGALRSAPLHPVTTG